MTATSSTAAVFSLLVAILSFQAGASVAKQLIPVVGAPGTTALRLGLSAVLVCLLYIVFGQKAGRAHGATAATWGMLIAASFTVPIGMAQAGRALLAPSVLSKGLALAVLSSALPYTLEMIALRRLATKTFGTLMSLEPAVAALVGLALLHERLTPTQWTAIAAVIIASIGIVGSEAGKADVSG